MTVFGVRSSAPGWLGLAGALCGGTHLTPPNPLTRRPQAVEQKNDDANDWKEHEMTQPEALRLAEQLEAIGLHGPVAAELRRLQEDNEALKRRVEALNQALRQWLDKTEWIQETGRGSELGLHRADAVRQRLARAEAQRDALLEALKRYVDHFGDPLKCARAAIAKAEGEKA